MDTTEVLQLKKIRTNGLKLKTDCNMDTTYRIQYKNRNLKERM